MSPGPKRLFFALACAAIGFFIAMSLAPRGGARHTDRAWGGDFFGSQGLTLGTVGAGIGLVVGLILALRRGGTAPPRPGSSVRGESLRARLRRRRRRDAPKRFGKRGC